MKFELQLNERYSVITNQNLSKLKNFHEIMILKMEILKTVRWIREKIEYCSCVYKEKIRLIKKKKQTLKYFS